MKTVLRKLFIIVVAAAQIVAFTVAGYAADWSFYGSVRMATWWTDQDSDAGDDDELEWALQKNSRIGARVKNDTISGRFEFGADETSLKLRYLYGTWDFGLGKFYAGQYLTPAIFLVSNQVFNGDESLLSFGGGMWPGRRPALSVLFGGLLSTQAWFGLVQPKTASPIIPDDGDGDNVLPKIEASLAYKKNWFRVRVIGGYQTYEVENSTIGDYDVDAYVIGIGCFATTGPLTIKASLTYGSNWSNYGVYTTGRSSAFIADTSVDDTTSFGTGGSIRYEATDLLSFEAGYGYVQHDPDVSDQQEDNTQAYYFQCSFNPAKGVYFIPEIGFVDFMEDASGESEGSNTYIGAQWKINF